MRSPTTYTVREAGEAWLAAARTGAVRNRSGDQYKPSAAVAYGRALRLRINPEIGSKRLSDVTTADLQDLVDRLVAEGLNASTVSCALLPLRAIYRRAVGRGEIAINPTSGVAMPAVRGGRDKIVDPAQAAKLIAALPERDQALWATALYAGLRRGELQALRWSDVDLAAGLIHVERSYDENARVYVSPKSAKGRRKVPIAAVLRDRLVDHRMASEADGLVFGRSPVTPFAPGAVTHRAAKAWADAGLDRIVLHEARHTFASLMIAAGVNAKALSTYMGHASINITMDRYGHLMPGSEAEAAQLLDEYLTRASERAEDAARSAVVVEEVAS